MRVEAVAAYIHRAEVYHPAVCRGGGFCTFCSHSLSVGFAHYKQATSVFQARIQVEIIQHENDLTRQGEPDGSKSNANSFALLAGNRSGDRVNGGRRSLLLLLLLAGYQGGGGDGEDGDGLHI